MHFKDILRLSAFNARRAKSRAILTALSICVGVSSVMLISTLGDSGSALISNEIDKIGMSGITVYSKKADIYLEEDYIKVISKNVPSALEVQPLIIESGNYYIKNQKGNTVIWGVDSNVSNVISLELLYGRLPTNADISQKSKVAVVDTEFANSIYNRTNIVGKEIILTVANVSERFEIIGVVASQKDGINQMFGGIMPHFIYVPYKTLAMIRGKNTISQIAVKSNSTAENDKVGEQAVATLSRVSGLDNAFGYENINTHITRFKGISSIVALLISAIAAISLIVAGLGIMNTMLASTNERREEIGVMMAIGAKRCDIAYCFMTESAIISSVGGTVGAISGIALSLAITTMFNMPTVISLGKLFFVVLLSLLCGIIFSLIPAYRASRLNPVEILHK